MSNRFPLRVAIMDDDFYALKGVAALLSRDLRTMIVDECSSAESLLSTLKKSRPKPDVILIDAEYRGGLIQIDDLLRRARRSAPEAVIIYWTQYADPQPVRAAAAANVNAIFVKSEVELGLATAIERAYIAERACTPSVSKLLRGHYDAWLADAVRIEKWELHPDLSPRLEQVFWLCIIYGMSVRAAAAEMCVQPETVERYRMKIYDIIDDGWNNEKYLAAARERIVGAQEATRSINWAFHMMTQPPRLVGIQ
ncbi:MAG: response regulator [Candidatus Promineifilaceae bacterium]